MDLTILQDIRELENDLFASLKAGPSQLNVFQTAWTAFCDTVKSSADKLSEATLEQLYSLASTVESLTSNIADYEEAFDVLEQETSLDVAEVLDEGLGAPSSESEQSSSSSLPAYIAPSWRWLCANLHNPYPSQSIREAIAQESGFPRKLVDNWFVDSRRRIGWNAVRKEHFDNKRTKIVEASMRFFASQEPSDLPPSIENKFAAIECSAKALYSDKLDMSRLATQLDRAVEDMTPERQERLRKRKKAQSYPSPTPSPERTTQSLSPESSISDLLESSMPSVSSLKRRRSDVFDRESTSAKRQRSDNPGRSTPADSQDSLPSPATSQVTLEETTSTTTSGTQPSLNAPITTPLSASTSPSLKRKRRFSGSEGEPRQKRPQGVSPEPRKQTVSNPLPISLTTLEQWFPDFTMSSFPSLTDVPPPVSVDAPDSTAPLEIEIFNFPPCTPPSQPSSDATTPCPVADPLHLFLQGSAPGPSATQPSASTSQHPNDFFDWLNADSALVNVDQNLLSANLSQVPQVWPEFTLPDDNFPFVDLSRSFLVQQQPEHHAPPALHVADTYTQQLKEEKQRQLQALEAQLQIIRAEIAAIS